MCSVCVWFDVQFVFSLCSVCVQFEPCYVWNHCFYNVFQQHPPESDPKLNTNCTKTPHKLNIEMNTNFTSNHTQSELKLHTMWCPVHIKFRRNWTQTWHVCMFNLRAVWPKLHSHWTLCTINTWADLYVRSIITYHMVTVYAIAYVSHRYCISYITCHMLCAADHACYISCIKWPIILTICYIPYNLHITLQATYYAWYGTGTASSIPYHKSEVLLSCIFLFLQSLYRLAAPSNTPP